VSGPAGAEITALREIAAAATELDTYEDFSVAGYCKACRPANPEGWNAARGRLHLALASLERDEAAPPSSGAAELRAVWAGIVKAAAGCPVPTGVCQDRCGPERCELDAAITAAGAEDREGLLRAVASMLSEYLEIMPSITGLFSRVKEHEAAVATEILTGRTTNVLARVRAALAAARPPSPQ
jgi:hypothetical protein